MKRFLTTFIATGLVWATAVCADPKPSGPHRFITTHFSDLATSCLAVPAPAHESYFINPVIALQIDAVRVDGILITPMPVKGADIEPGLEYYSPVLPETMVYQVPVSRLWTLRSLDKITGHMAIEEYAVPADARRIEVEYRVRYPKNRVSSDLLFISVHVDEFKSKENEPNKALVPTVMSVTPAANAPDTTAAYL